MRSQVVATELLKLRRSAVPWVTLGAILCGPLGVALLMWIVRDPARAASLGLLGTKANLAGLDATWPAFGSYLAVVVGAGGMLLLAFVVAHLFGREYADATAKNLLTLPVPRGWFVLAKLAVAALWWLALTVAALAGGFAIGSAMALPGLTPAVVARTVGAVLVGAAATFLLAPVVAWVTIWSRNYLAPLGFALGMLLLGDVLGHTGWAVWFPWSIVPVVTGMVGASAPELGWGSYLVLALTFGLGVAGSVLHLHLADNP
jgi:ABC-2 type transport system permease protein